MVQEFVSATILRSSCKMQVRPRERGREGEGWEREREDDV
jgi:hypothetical protein